MKFATYLHRDRQSYGVVRSGGICDLPACWPAGPTSVLGLLQAGPQALQAAAARAGRCDRLIPEADVRLLAPIPNGADRARHARHAAAVSNRGG